MASKYSFIGLFYKLWNILNPELEKNQYKRHTTQI